LGALATGRAELGAQGSGPFWSSSSHVCRARSSLEHRQWLERAESTRAAVNRLDEAFKGTTRDKKSFEGVGAGLRPRTHKKVTSQSFVATDGLNVTPAIARQL
jgi:hypothetical protein